LGSIESEKLKYQNRIQTDQGIAPDSDMEYLQTCFRYIHNNPVKAALVEKEADWEFSSARDFAFLRNGTLINRNLCDQLGLFILK
jgi:putative transposase